MYVFVAFPQKATGPPEAPHEEKGSLKVTNSKNQVLLRFLNFLVSSSFLVEKPSKKAKNIFGDFLDTHLAKLGGLLKFFSPLGVWKANPRRLLKRITKTNEKQPFKVIR